jgi:hypothetical protein
VQTEPNLLHAKTRPEKSLSASYRLRYIQIRKRSAN